LSLTRSPFFQQFLEQVDRKETLGEAALEAAVLLLELLEAVSLLTAMPP
jgi:hypothetical protein